MVVALLRQPITWVQRVRVPDGEGGLIESDQVQGVLRGRVSLLRLSETPRTLAEHLRQMPKYELVLDTPAGAAIRESDRFMVGTQRYMAVMVQTAGRITRVLAVEA